VSTCDLRLGVDSREFGPQSEARQPNTASATIEKLTFGA